MRVSHFYHVYASGSWREPLSEHLWALNEAEYDGAFHVGIVGPPERRAEVLDELNCIRPPDSATEADDGWEQVTLQPLREYVQRTHSGAVMYAHTKGAYNTCDINTAWRRSMTAHVVVNWRKWVTAVGKNYDAVGCHWLTPEQYPTAVTSPFFGGTYWVASVKYLRRLPECATDSRYDAEAWIGLKNPRVLDLRPGWPGNPPFERHRYGRLTASHALT